ncbi:hypothetical protein ACHAWF_018671 [Thalassiosira exigua]
MASRGEVAGHGHGPGFGPGDAPRSPRARMTKALHKWLLGISWLLVVAHIWTSPDGDGDDGLSEPSFWEPMTEAALDPRPGARADVPRVPMVAKKFRGGRDVREDLGDLRIPGVDLMEMEGSLERDSESGVKADEEAYDAASNDALGSPGEVQNDSGSEPRDAEVSQSAGEEEGSRDDLSKRTDKADSGSEDAIGSPVEVVGSGSKPPRKDASQSAEKVEGYSKSRDDLSNKSAMNSAVDLAKDNASEDESEETEPTKSEDVLVEALEPVTFQGCCIPAIFNGTRDPKGVDCPRTCYNQRACDDPLYPFASEEEKAAFPFRVPKPGPTFRLKRKECLDVDPTPPVKWCQKPYEGKGPDAAAHLVKHYPPAGCSNALSASGGSGAFQHAIVFPAAKFVFCGIPKVGITQWEMFLRFTMGAKDYPSMPHYKLDRELLQFDKLEPEAQRRIWEDKEWTWAAFLRDPAERLLSAYLDKVKGKAGKRMKLHNESMTFEEFIDYLSKPVAHVNATSAKGMHGLSWFSDPHWRPQVYSCGLSERLDRFQFIGELGNVEAHTKELLQHVGLWDSHRKHFINGGVKVGRNPWCNIQSHPVNGTQHVGFQQKDEVSNATGAKNEYGHIKNSRKKMDRFYTPELLNRVQEELYADDQKLWKLVSNGNKLSRGKELMPKLSSRCSDPSFKTTIIYQ